MVLWGREWSVSFWLTQRFFSGCLLGPQTPPFWCSWGIAWELTVLLIITWLAIHGTILAPRLIGEPPPQHWYVGVWIWMSPQGSCVEEAVLSWVHIKDIKECANLSVGLFGRRRQVGTVFEGCKKTQNPCPMAATSWAAFLYHTPTPTPQPLHCLTADQKCNDRHTQTRSQINLPPVGILSQQRKMISITRVISPLEP